MATGGALQRWVEKYVFNPPSRLGLRLGISPRAFALLETTGRRTGWRRLTPVGNGLDGSTFWVVAEHGERCDYVKNLVADPSVRVKLGRRWYSGSATVVADDDAFARRRGIDDSNGVVGRLDGAIFRASASEPVTIRIDVESPPPPRKAARPPQLRYVDPYERRGRLYLALCQFSVTKAGAWLTPKVSWKVDPYLLKLTRGRFATTGPVATALLESRGARTGKPRRNATLYFHDGDRVTIIASRLGAPRNPAWYHNLRNHPDVLFGGQPFRAEIVEDEAERERLWGLADRVFPQYADYREQAGKAGRAIPIFQLVRR